MCPTKDGPDGGGKRGRPEHSPEEIEAFEDRVETLAGMARLSEASGRADMEALKEERRVLRQQGLSHGEVEARVAGSVNSLRRNTILFMALVVVLIVALALFYGQGIDITSPLSGGGGMAEAQRIAPPEPASTPAEILPPEVFRSICEDCDEVVEQVPLDLNPAAKHQFGYDSAGSRVAIFTILDAEAYERYAEMIDESHEMRVAESGAVPEPPRHLDDVGEGAIVYDGLAVFRNGDSCGIVTGNRLMDVEGEPFDTVTVDELEKIARIAAPRMR